MNAMKFSMAIWIASPAASKSIFSIKEIGLKLEDGLQATDKRRPFLSLSLELA